MKMAMKMAVGEKKVFSYRYGLSQLAGVGILGTEPGICRLLAAAIAEAAWTPFFSLLGSLDSPAPSLLFVVVDDEIVEEEEAAAAILLLAAAAAAVRVSVADRKDEASILPKESS